MASRFEPVWHSWMGARIALLVHLCCLYAGATIHDLRTDGECNEIISKDCSHVAPGRDRVARCVQHSLANGGHPASETTRCKEELTGYWAKSIRQSFGFGGWRVNPPGPVRGLNKYCQKDVQKHCADVPPGSRLQCLKPLKDRLSLACRERITSMQIFQSKHVKFNPQLADACEADLNTFCSGVRSFSHQIGCLKSNRKKLSDTCAEKVFRREQEDAEDIRFDASILESCRSDISKHCSNYEYGEARILKCLWESIIGRKRFELDTKCVEKVRDTTERSVSDYRLDFRVRKYCGRDITQSCSKERDIVDRLPLRDLFKGNKSGQVLSCLKWHYRSISSPSCKLEINRMVRIQSWHAHADPVLMKHCQPDLELWCRTATPQNLHLCLRKNLAHLSAKCRQEEIVHNSVESRDASLKPVMFTACSAAIGQFCRDVPVGHGNLIHCLQDHMDKSSFPAACRKHVYLDLEASNHDWRLKFGVSHECKRDIDLLCSEQKRRGGGAVLGCMKDRLEHIKEKDCLVEMQRLIRQSMGDIHLGPAFSNCSDDVQRFCGDVEPGSGRIHECLMKNRPMLSSRCSSTEFHMQKLVSRDISLSTQIMTDCQVAIKQVCSRVQPGDGHVWSCLEEHLNSIYVDSKCRGRIEAHMKLKHSEFQLNPKISQLCTPDATKLCPNEFHAQNLTSMKFTNDGVVTCLIVHREQISSKECQVSLQKMVAQRLANPSLDDVCTLDIQRFCAEANEQGPRAAMDCMQADPARLSEKCRQRQEIYVHLAATDINLNTRLETCNTMRQSVCSSVKAGNSRVLSCLVNHMHDASFDIECRRTLVLEQARWLKFSSVHPFLLGSCNEEFKKLRSGGECPMVNGREDVLCLFSHMESLGSLCKSAVAQHRKRISADLFAFVGMQEACRSDVNALCKNTQRGSGNVHACLRANKTKIASSSCKSMVSEVEAVDRAHASINFQTRKGCAREMLRFCDDVQPGNSRILTCLGLHRNMTGFGEECKDALGSTDVAAVLTAKFKERFSMSVEDFEQFLTSQRGLVSRFGGPLLVLSVCTTALLSFTISYFYLKRKSKKTMYTVSYPSGPDQP